jgi:glycerol-3-phosphate dehydrogenase
LKTRFLNEKSDYGVTRDVMNQLFSEAKELLPPIGIKDVIRNYSGIRSKLVGPQVGGFGDFVIEESKVVEGLIQLIGIESPGLTSSVPISKIVRDIIGNKEDLKEKSEFVSERKGILEFRQLSFEEKDRLVRECPDYGEIVCRCEHITKKEIMDAIENPLGVKTLAGIKYRARAMMGRCQGGYCLTRIVEILSKEYKIPVEEITLRGKKSRLFEGRVK